MDSIQVDNEMQTLEVHAKALQVLKMKRITERLNCNALARTLICHAACLCDAERSDSTAQTPMSMF